MVWRVFFNFSESKNSLEDEIYLTKSQHPVQNFTLKQKSMPLHIWQHAKTVCETLQNV
jgi:hypothetical protein